MQAVNNTSTPYKQRKITPGRIKKIHALARIVVDRYGIWDDIKNWKEDWLYPQFGISSTTQLSIAQADKVIQVLTKEAGQQAVQSTFGQRQKITALRKLLGWDRNRLFSFINRQTGFNKSESMLTKMEATELIVAMQRIYSGSNKNVYKIINAASPQWLSSPEGRAALITAMNSPTQA